MKTCEFHWPWDLGSYGVLTHTFFNSWYDSGEDSEFDEDDFMSDNSSQE
jgi:hypothetical protein